MRLRHSLSKPIAFGVSLAAAPLIVCAIGILVHVLGRAFDGSPFEPIGLIGVVIILSAPAGGASYLLVGGFLFWRTMREGKTRTANYAAAGFVANVLAAVLSFPIMLLASALMPELDPGQAILITLIIHGFGLIFGPLYGMIFGWFFTRLAKDLGRGGPDPREVQAVFQ